MRKYLIVLLVLFAVVLSTIEARAQQNDISQAEQLITALKTGNYEQIIAAAKPEYKSFFTTAILQQFNKAATLRGWGYYLGELSEKPIDGLKLKGNAVYNKGSIINTVMVFDHHQLTHMFMESRVSPVSKYRDPLYKESSKYTEQPFVLQTGPFILPGTLTIPNRSRKFPLLIFVHGSGSNDRDESLYSLKPFRDLALGLAAKGIATLRYDKRNKIYGEADVPDGEYQTIGTETTDDAATAIKLALNIPGVDPKQVYVIGHSQGGMMLPKILVDNRLLSGGIIMSGPSVSLLQSYEDEYRQIQVMDESTRKHAFDDIAKIKHIESGSNPFTLLLGHPVGFWLDIGEYDQLRVIQQNHKPLLILQGERDYQVPPSELAGWQTALQGHSEVKIKTYPKLNHFYMEGTGPATGQEYYDPGNVPSYVINDIADWILGNAHP